MRLRIIGTGEKSAHAWYARRTGQEFEIVGESDGTPGHWTVDTSHLQSKGELENNYAFVTKSDAELLAEQESSEVESQGD